MFDIKSYDKKLKYNKNRDGSIELVRVSPFNVKREHFLIRLENQYLGSQLWIKNKLLRMDNQRVDVAGSARRRNNQIRKRKENTRKQTSEIADFILSGGDAFVT